MSTATKRIEGAAEEFKGKIKKGFGRLIGDEETEAEGQGEELVGRAKQEAAKAAERFKGKTEQVIGTVKEHVGRALDNKEMKEVKGRAREKANQ